MRKIQYTYCLVKYMHDPRTGEMLNIGVLLCAPTARFVGVRFNQHYKRLSEAFVNFDGEHYREIITRLERSVQELKPNSSESELFVLKEKSENVEQVIKSLAPDRGLSIQFGPMLAGLTDDPEDELSHIFDQSVISQYPHKEKRGRDDEEVWNHFRRPLVEKSLVKYLKPKVFESESYEYKFEHAFKNENWHVLKPVTMDYAQSHSIQDRATRVFGEASALEGNPELGTYYILLGKPSLDSHKISYIKAKNLLNKIPIKKEIIEEDAAKDFAEELTGYMKEHGLIQ